jgi:hypothetical protein
MQLDKTAIAITQRNLDELLDLSLTVLRRYGLILIKPALLGVIPFFILNAALLWSRTMWGHSGLQVDPWHHSGFLWLTAILVYVESPLALAGVTIVLGNTMFGIANTRQATAGTLRTQSLALVWILGFLRGIIPLIAIVFCFDYLMISRTPTDSIRYFWIGLLLTVIVLVRGARPFAPEIILLEKCRVFAEKTKDPKTSLTYSLRSSRVHAGGVELFFVMLAAGMIGAAFLLVLNLTSTFLIGSLAGAWSWGWWMDLVLFPLSLWTVAFWATILRFLVYMNTRIRGEGWELELKLKAEARRVQDAEERKSA